MFPIDKLKEWKKTFFSEENNFKTSFDEYVEPLYISSHYDEKLGFPGEYPFTRGVHPTMYREKLWTFRQYSGYGSPEESNKRYHYLLKQGQTGLSVAFDLPTQIGYDSDHPLVKSEVGKVGVPIDSLYDMELLFSNIPLDKVSVSMTINSTAPILLSMYCALAEKRKIPLDTLRGTIQNDVLKEYIARGTYIFPVRPSLKLVVDLIEFCMNNLPKWNPISISGYHIREAGASSVQELAFTFANAITYVEESLKRGLNIDDFAPRISFFFDVHNHLLEEVSKFRAARRIWAKIMRERFHAKNPRSQMLRFHCQTAGCTLTAQQPFNNIVRVTIQALAAALGGTQSLHTNAMDEALALPTEQSAEIALRTQQIIAYESGITSTIDPLGGSYYVEWLTDRIETLVFEYIEKIGDMVSAIENGIPQKEIENSSYRYQKEIENNERMIVGLNAFTESSYKPVKTFRFLNKNKKQIEQLKKLKKKRDNGKVINAIQKIKDIAISGDNLIPPIIDAVKHYTTLGEISDALREVFGEHKEFTMS